MVDAAACYLSQDMGRRVVIGPNPVQTRATAILAPDHRPVTILRIMSRMLLTCPGIGCIGADILDGVYGKSQVFKRLRMLRIAHAVGRKTRVFGASWSETPHPEVAAALRRASWLEICARDPISQARMEKAFGRPVPLVADLAFLLKPELRAGAARTGHNWITAQQQIGRVVMGVNLSGHTVGTLPGDGVRSVAQPIIRWLLADPQRAVILMPHDRRGGKVGDGTALTALHDILSADFADRMHSLPVTLDTWEMKAIAGATDLILTGRMHLAIAALGMGTPAFCTVYQGKFEGLMQMFGLEDMTIAPSLMDSAECDAKLARVTRQRQQLSARIQARLPQIVEMSRSNFAGM
ncbi:polysaccharide pyruvyl transferase family protein [Paracoccus amoyensis]|nr:polysaccharide pyruvyl transferase family protein [Paracoccus amoyensis]